MHELCIWVDMNFGICFFFFFFPPTNPSCLPFVFFILLFHGIAWSFDFYERHEP
jgi:hypothetical protein